MIGLYEKKMYREVYDEEKRQIYIEKNGYKDKVIIALMEDGVIRKTYRHLKTSVINLPKNIDEFIGTVMRYVVMGRKKVIPNRIVFSTFQNSYTCNSKYIIQKIIEKKLDYEMIFIVDKKNFDEPDLYEIPRQVKVVKRNSVASFFALATAHFWVDNAINCIWKRIPKKKNQIYINTWHGSLGIKRLSGNEYWKKVAKRGNKVIDYFVTDSVFEENVFKESFWPDVKCLKYGHPRNDIFFHENKMREIKKKVYEFYGIDMSIKTVLYAPTFRDNKSDVSAINIDCAMLKEALEKRFGGEWKVVTRLHFHNANNKKTKDAFSKYEDIVDASTYFDIQELMAAVDIGITDYSSWIFDFCLTNRPAFIYAKDINKYVNSRGFYYPLSETPFSIADSDDILCSNILDFDEQEYHNKVKQFLNDKQCYEVGNASERLVQFICDNTY